MTAAAEATRGPIEEVTHIRYGMTRDADEADRTSAMERVLEELDTVLAEPIYEGDIQTALLHNMGRAAFGFEGAGDDEVHSFIKFADAIDADKDAGPTPVLLVSQIEAGAGRHGNTETALVMVDPEEAMFRSTMTHQTDIENTDYSDKIAITRRTLSLVGDTSTIHADISGYGHDRREIHRHADRRTGQEELVLQEAHMIDGKNRRTPISVDEEGFRYGRDIDRMWAGPTYVIGWEAIGNALAMRIHSNVHGYHEGDEEPQGTLPYILNLRGFLESAGQLDTLLERNAALKKVFEHAVSLDESVAALVPATSHED